MRRCDAAVGRPLEIFARAAVLLVLAAGALLTLAYQSQAITFPYALDYGEGPMLDQALRLNAGDAIYSADLRSAPFTISNYPPLFLLCMSLCARLFGAAYWYGRSLSGVSAFAIAGCLALLVQRRTRSTLAATITGLLFLSFPFVTTWSALCKSDLLALALTCAALLTVGGQCCERTTWIVASVLFLAAICTRQTHLLAGPLAAVVTLRADSGGWRAPLQLVASIALGLAVLVAIGLSCTQGGLFTHLLLANVNSFEFAELRDGFAYLWSSSHLAICIGVAILFLRGRSPLFALASSFLLGAALSATAIGKLGSNYNYFLELCAALSLAAGAVIGWLTTGEHLRLVRVAVLCALAWQGLSFSSSTLASSVEDLREHWGQLAELKQLRQLVHAARAPVLADEQIGVLPLAGKPIYLQPFEFTQLARAGTWDEAPLLRAIERRTFAYVVLERAPVSWLSRRWTTNMLRTIGSCYVPQRTLAGSVVWTPRDPDSLRTMGAHPTQ